jgi:hypothetical protein
VGATSASYTTPATTAADDGSQFAVVVNNSAGSVTSNSATLTVEASVVPVAPSITTQPVSQTVTAGQSATFFVVATGTEPLSYQWKNGNRSIKGATSAAYTIPTTTTGDSGSQFKVVVSNAVGSVTSDSATLTVQAPVPPTITTQPANQTVPLGQPATFFVVATGTDPLSFQWKKNGASIAGATSAAYTTPATTVDDNGSQFAVTVSNVAGQTTSAAATLTVLIPGPLHSNLPSVNFGNVDVGDSSSVQVQLTNDGTAGLTISSVAISGSGFGTSGLSTGQVLPAGGNALLTVNFVPGTAATATGSVTIGSNAIDSPTTIALSGTGVVLPAHSVDLFWSASTSSVIGYRVYRAQSPGGPYTSLNSVPVTTTQYLDLVVQAGQTYYYVVTAVDSHDVESEYSNEVSTTIPTP